MPVVREKLFMYYRDKSVHDDYNFMMIIFIHCSSIVAEKNYSIALIGKISPDSL